MRPRPGNTPKSAPEIRALIAAFNRLRVRVSSLLQARMVLVSGISHDLRTYAARLRLRAEMIDDEIERSKAVRDLDDMKKLLDDSLIVFDAATPPRAQELFEIAPLLRREVEDRRLGGTPVALTISTAGESAQVLGDPLSVRRLVANLTDNAIAYGREASIDLDSADGAVVLTIDDKGPGISPHQRQRVLEPFVRLEESRNRNTGGAGLGLAIAQKAAESHGGTLTLADAPGGGTRATVRLPLFNPRA